MLPALGAPDWVLRGVVIVAGLGLVLALILAWAFDLTPEGLRRAGGVGPAGPASGTGTSPEVSSWLSARTIVAVLALVAVSATAGWWVGGSAAAREETAAGDLTIAVLRFDDFSSGADQEWFAAGMQEALITALQQIGALRVTSRTSSARYADTNLSLPEIAGELGTRWLVEGSVVRAGDRIRITAQLIDGATDEPVWAEDYEDEVEDILSLQSNVARAIAGEINVTLSPAEEERLGAAPRIDPDAYRAYVLGLDRLYRITPAGFRRSVPLFEEAIARDPTFASAHAALAVGYATAVEYDWIPPDEAEEPAERAAEAAIRLDADASESHHARGSVAYHLHRDFEQAERAYREAMARNPTAYALQDFAWMLANLGRHEEAIPIAEQATRIDPRSPLARTDVGWWKFGVGDYNGAIEEGLRAMEIDADYGEAHWMLSTVYAHLDQPEEALGAFDRYEALYGEPIPYYRGYLLAVLGRREEALSLAREVEARIARGESVAGELALIYVALGERERALDAVEEIEKGSISFMPYLWPDWASLYDEPRFVAVLERIGFPPPP